jgi:ABC-type branched-subunit amino acid transport system substrate-binding protein
LSATENSPVFTGVHTVLDMIAVLCRRPRFWYRSRHDEDRGETPLPLICLVREQSSNDFLQALSAKLREASVPNVLIDAARATEQVRKRFNASQASGQGSASELPMLPLLDQVRHGLGLQRHDRVRLSRFDRYRLADWLTRQYLAPATQRDDGAGIVRLLRSWISKGREKPDIPFEADQGRVTFWLWVLLHIGPALWFWLWTRGRESRWFMGQDYLTAHSPDFLSFAQRLTRGDREAGSEEEVKKLLTHALLEDLRVAYRRQLLPFRPRVWRRGAHAVVLLDNLTEENGGWELLRLVNDVRNETGDPDPLLVIAAGDPPPADSDEASLSVARPDRSMDALESWRTALPGRRQRKEPLARYLPVSLPTAVSTNSRSSLSSDDEFAWRRVDFHPDRAPVLARRHVVAVLAVVLLLTSGGVGMRSAMPRYDSGCFPFGMGDMTVPWMESFIPPDLAGVDVRPELMEDTWQCVGYSDNTVQVFGNGGRLRAVQHEVFRENLSAVAGHEDKPDRPLVSLVYFAALTGIEEDLTKETSLSEELKGLLLWQRKLNHDGSSDDPFLRVIVANGGHNMDASDDVVQEMIAPLVRNDSTVLGVVGMNRTTRITKRAITMLGDLGVPVVTTTLTVQDLENTSPLYFQLAPGNDIQAQLVRKYLGEKSDTVAIYHPETADEENEYVTDLVDQVHTALRDGPPHPVDWGAPELSEMKCDGGEHDPDVVFYAGQGEGFKEFLNKLAGTCGRVSEYPEVIGSDATARLFTDSEDRNEVISHGISVHYVSLGVPTALAGAGCVSDGTPTNIKLAELTPVSRFCRAYRELANKVDKESDDWFLDRPTERMGVAYDAAGLFHAAIMKNSGIDRNGEWHIPHRAAIAAQLREVSYGGVTGRFDFRTSRVADGRVLGMLRFDAKDAIPECELAIGDVADSVKPEDIDCGS